MRSTTLKALCGTTLLLAGIDLAHAGDPTFTCAITEGGKRMTIRGTNESSQTIRCDAVSCEAFTRVAGGTRKCEVSTPIVLPAKANGQVIGSCFDADNPVTRLVGVRFSCGG